MRKVWGFHGHEMKKVIIAPQRNCGKVMFSQVFVYSQRGQGMYLWSQVPSGGRYLWYQVTSGVGISGTRSLREGGKYTWR